MSRCIVVLVLVIATLVGVSAPETLPAGDRARDRRTNAGWKNPAQRWDDVLVGTWYVPASNLLAYLVPGEGDPIALGDQTIFQIHSAHNGAFLGESFTELSEPTTDETLAQPITFEMNGLVTPEGQIRINFTNSNSHVVGVGSMQLVGGRWRMTMQMASGSSEFITHWAYMTKLQSHQTPPEPADIQPTPSRDRAWKWLLGTTWKIRDTELPEPSGRRRRQSDSGTFEIEGYRGNYFWGSVAAASPFRIVGSVTPEGSLLLILLPEDGDAFTRTGVIAPAGGCQWSMVFRSYEDESGHGAAWLLGD